MADSAGGRAGAATLAQLKGIGWIVVSGLLFVAVTGTVRHLGSDMNPMQAAFLRYAFGLVLMAPVLVRLGRERLRHARLALHAVRGLVHALAVMLWFYAMARIPIAQVTALGFTAPIFTTLGAALFLGERLRARRVVAVLAGFAGALVILRPGLVAVNPGAIAQLVAAPMFATSFLLAKKLTETDSNAVIVGLMAVFVTLALAPPALAVWRTPSPQELAWLAATAVFATAGHAALTQAFRSAEIGVLQPATFLQLVWATLLGLYAFGEAPDAWTWAGGGVIVASASYIAHRESRTRRTARIGVRPRF